MENTKEFTARLRRDPLNEVVDYDSLKIAFDLLLRKQNHTYWETVRTPRRPNGTVRFEVLRQLATFVVPVLMYLFAAMHLHYGFLWALAGAPAYLLVGYVFDVHLTRAIRIQTAKDEALDRGRYGATQLLSQRLGLAPEEITLARVIKMSQDFMVVDSKMFVAEKHAAAERKAAEAARRAQANRVYEPNTIGVTAQTGTAVMAADAAAAAQAYHDDVNTQPVYPEVELFQPQYQAPAYNVANGMPMMGDSNIDVTGHVYGTGGFENQ